MEHQQGLKKHQQRHHFRKIRKFMQYLGFYTQKEPKALMHVRVGGKFLKSENMS